MAEQTSSGVSIGIALPRWRALKEEKGLRGHTDMALFLLDWWVLLTLINIKSILSKSWTVVLSRHTGDIVWISGKWGPNSGRCLSDCCKRKSHLFCFFYSSVSLSHCTLFYKTCRRCSQTADITHSHSCISIRSVVWYFFTPYYSSGFMLFFSYFVLFLCVGHSLKFLLYSLLLHFILCVPVKRLWFWKVLHE